MLRSGFSLLVLCLLAVLFARECHSALTSDQQLHAILNLSLNTLKNNGKLQSILNKYQAVDTGMNCSLQGQTTWPASSELGSAMKQILTSGNIRFCRTETLTNTYFNITSGLDYEIGKEIASLISAQYGKTIEASWMRLATKTAGFFPTLLDALDLNTCDAGMGLIVITPDRQLLANFTCPYMNVFSGYLQGPRNLSLDLPTLASLNQSGLIIALLPGTALGDLAATFTNATLMPVPDTATGLQRVADGVASVFMAEMGLMKNVDCPTCKSYRFGNPSQLGIVTRKTAGYSVSSSVMITCCWTMIIGVLLLFILQ